MNNQYLEHALIMLNKVEERVNSEIRTLDRQQINWKPDDRSWSVAECLDHLIQTNSSYFNVFDDIKNNRVKKPFLARMPGWSSFCSKMILKSVDPDTKRKSKTFKVFQPSASDYARTIVDNFLQNLSQLKVYLNELDGYDDHFKIKFTSPVSSGVVLDLESAIDILWNHEVRHLNQAKRVTTLEGFPS